MPNPLDDAIEKVITIGCKCESTIAQHREAVDKLVQLVRTRTLEEAEVVFDKLSQDFEHISVGCRIKYPSNMRGYGFNNGVKDLSEKFRVAIGKRRKSLAPDSSGEGKV